MNQGEYFQAIESFYMERLKASLKDKFKKCSKCTNLREFTINDGSLTITCSSSCEKQTTINLNEYLNYPEMKLAIESGMNYTLNPGKFSEIFTEEEIKVYQTYIKDQQSLLSDLYKQYKQQNSLSKKQTLMKETHRERIKLKKEQSILLKKIDEELDPSKKGELRKKYLEINQKLKDDYQVLLDQNRLVNKFLITEEGSVKQSVEPKPTPKQETSTNLIPELQDAVSEDSQRNNLTMNLIVAYRDPGDGSRKSQLKMFKQQMNELFKDQTKLKIYIIEQESNRTDYASLPDLLKQEGTSMAKFNLGVLKNIGFHMASKKHNKGEYYILSDVDLLPSPELIKDYLTYPESPIHLANMGTRYNVDGSDPNFLGGVISVSKQDFEKANGYPNNFWGWGGEDNALNVRFKKNNIKVTKSTAPVIDLEKYTIKEKMAKLKQEKLKEMRKWEKLDEDKETWKENGLSNLDETYKVLKKMKKDNITHIKVYLEVNKEKQEEIEREVLDEEVIPESTLNLPDQQVAVLQNQS